MTQPPIIPGPPSPFDDMPKAPQYEPPSTMSGDPRIQIIRRPGGLTATEHIVHLIVAFFTCGLWLPIYALFYVLAPFKRVEISAPYGVDPQVVARVHAEALALTPAEVSMKRTRTIVVLSFAMVPVLVIFVVIIFNVAT